MDQGPIEQTLCGMPLPELAEFPTTGFRARTLARFERDFGAWLDTAEGRFERWTAARRVEEPVR